LVTARRPVNAPAAGSSSAPVPPGAILRA